MSDVVIQAESIGKRYVIGHEVRHDTLRDTLAQGARGFWARLRGGTASRDPAREDFWALRDISFAVKRGEVLGIIGRNGAGKSTLLKILSRITEPTAGRIAIRGRVSSLLEVGTGFHPELSGRENIFLNGAILGMARAEIRRKFDEIVAFAEVERFLDTPVKHYSSGMYVRLAFAVAAHLEPEILIVDEVLSVGDAAFQKKCLGKMQDVAMNGGRTVLLVSHQMTSIQRLCRHCIFLEAGRVSFDGAPGPAIERYSRHAISATPIIPLLERTRYGNSARQARLLAVTPAHADGAWMFKFGAAISFHVEIATDRALDSLQLGLGLFSASGTEIASATDEGSAIKPGRYTYTVTYGDLRPVPGIYSLNIGLRSSHGLEDYVSEALYFEVIPSDLSSQLRTETFSGHIVPHTQIQRLPATSAR